METKVKDEKVKFFFHSYIAGDSKKGIPSTTLDLRDEEGNIIATFKPGGKRLFEVKEEEGSGEKAKYFVLVNASVDFPDGDRACALLEINEADDCQVYGVHVFMPGGGIKDVTDDDFAQVTGKDEKELFPIQCRLRSSSHIERFAGLFFCDGDGRFGYFDPNQQTNEEEVAA